MTTRVVQTSEFISLDEDCGACGAFDKKEAVNVDHLDGLHGSPAGGEVCVRFLTREFKRELPSTTEHGMLRFDRFSEFLSTLPRASRSRLGACVWPECESVVLVPIRLADDEVGLLHIADPQPNRISVEMAESLERLSSELGAAIHRVRVEEALQAARGELEVRVLERTEELTKSNQALQHEIAERVRLERELLQASVREQQRIGQELHDGLGQELTGISYLAQSLVVKLNGKEAPEGILADELARGIRDVVGQIQKIVRGLVPFEIGAADLEPALRILASRMARQTGTACHFHSNCAVAMVDSDVAIQIYRIAQEAIANAVKHSHANAVDVTLTTNDDDGAVGSFRRWNWHFR